MLHAQKLNDLVALDAFKTAQLTPSLTASERAHLHSTRALCARTCPGWTWTLDEPAGRLEGSKREGETTMFIELHLSTMTHRWSGCISGLARDMSGYEVCTHGASALEVVLNLVAQLATASAPKTTEARKGCCR
jgi:hypothetical protein